MNFALYVVTVLIWGSTWLAIKWQLGVVPPPISIAWRFWLAGVVILLILRVMRRPLIPPRAAWPLLFAQGLALFCLNFLCFYYAEQTVPSGLVAVVFSIAPLLNAVNSKLFMGKPLQSTAIGGALLGLVGIACLAVQQLHGQTAVPGTLTGLCVALLGTLCFSTGSLLSSRMQASGLHPLQSNGWAMLIGAAILTLGSAVAGLPFTPAFEPRYIGALIYLAIPGSVIGFTAYLTLVGRIGPVRAAYCTVLFPFVALALSSCFEGYAWSPLAVVGLVLVVCGNLVAFNAPQKALAFLQQRPS